MSQTVRLKNVPRFNESLISILEHSRQDPEAIMRKQAKLFMEQLLKVTPPSYGNSTTGPQAKKRGEDTVEGNIRKVLDGVPVASDRKNLQNVTMKDIQKHHEANRVAGRVRGRNKGKGRMRVPTRMLGQYIKSRKQAVGMLAAGWRKSADEFNVKTGYYKWIKRHSPASAVSVKVNKRGIHIKMSNKTRYAGGVGVMEKRLNWALGRQAQNNEEIIKNFKSNARRQGFRVV